MPTALFIHGAWVGPACWEPFIGRFEAAGYRCVAPAWPFDDRPIAELRARPATELAGVGVQEIVDHYEQIARTLPEPPVLIGHSFGGLFVQMLLDRGVGAAGVAIDPAPPRGVLPTPGAFRASFSVLRTWRGWRKVLTVSFDDFSWGFLHNLREDEQRRVYDAQVIPTPGRTFFQVGFAMFNSATRVNFRNDGRAPLLIIAGEKDRTVPAAMNRANLKKYRHSNAATDLREFPGRSHWLIAEPGWEEVADHAIDWLGQRSSSAASEP
ncbi:MAG: alpha/beta hydrolase [Actinomycetota bacterium]